jgi:hypothetical protein
VKDADGEFSMRAGVLIYSMNVQQQHFLFRTKIGDVGLPERQVELFANAHRICRRQRLCTPRQRRSDLPFLI